MDVEDRDSLIVGAPSELGQVERLEQVNGMDRDFSLVDNRARGRFRLRAS